MTRRLRLIGLKKYHVLANLPTIQGNKARNCGQQCIMEGQNENEQEIIINGSRIFVKRGANDCEYKEKLKYDMKDILVGLHSTKGTETYQGIISSPPNNIPIPLRRNI